MAAGVPAMSAPLPIETRLRVNSHLVHDSHLVYMRCRQWGSSLLPAPPHPITAQLANSEPRLWGRQTRLLAFRPNLGGCCCRSLPLASTGSQRRWRQQPHLRHPLLRTRLVARSHAGLTARNPLPQMEHGASQLLRPPGPTHCRCQSLALMRQ